MDDGFLEIETKIGRYIQRHMMRGLTPFTAAMILCAMEPPQEIGTKLTQIQKHLDTFSLRLLVRFQPGEEGLDELFREQREKITSIRESLEEYRDLLKAQKDVLDEAIGVLGRNGLTYNVERGQVEVPPGPKGGRPRAWLRELIGYYWEGGRSAYRQETGDTAHNSQAIRDSIHAELKGLFPADLIDPREGGPIEKAIEYHLRTRNSATGNDGA